ncbi:hypothetical protein [Enterococcus wangshanyuanii]|uniref:Uncharacterized protein n=1 Tax=Enterococcus wangshanyuanii TaxID=2005703 RepID=A0ABQ1PJH4_9ENTE|nr:hypothetical protein [Enterococcus wangshanyuanii]GGC98182.1 hypothetical protein GCM10011573_29650 [Enterococcus wangshanyuanii]
MIVILVSVICSIGINILLSRRLVDKTTDMVASSVKDTLESVEEEYSNFFEIQEEGTARYWYMKGAKDSAKAINDLVTKIYK